MTSPINVVICFWFFVSVNFVVFFVIKELRRKRKCDCSIHLKLFAQILCCGTIQPRSTRNASDNISTVVLILFLF